MHKVWHCNWNTLLINIISFLSVSILFVVVPSLRLASVLLPLPVVSLTPGRICGLVVCVCLLDGFNFTAALNASVAFFPGGFCCSRCLTLDVW